MSNRTSDNVNSERKLLSPHFIPTVAFLLATVAMFLLGCFVIGPWYKNHSQSIETCTVVPPSVLHDGEESPLPSHNRSPRVTTGDDVSIKEIYPHKPAQSDRHSETSKSPDSSVTVNKSSSNPAGESDTSPAVSSNTVDSSNMETSSPSSIESKPESDAESSSQPLHRVRAGLFADKANADVLSAKLSSAGFAPAVHHIERDGRQLYVVQLGAFRSRENAEELAKSLRDSGFEATVTVDK